GCDAPDTAVDAAVAHWNRLLRDFDAVQQYAARRFALTDRGDRCWNHAIEVRLRNATAVCLTILRFQNELRKETNGTALAGLSRVDAIRTGDGLECLAGVLDSVDQVPDQLAFVGAVGLRHVDLDHAKRLERELQAIDLATEPGLVRHAVKCVG